MPSKFMLLFQSAELGHPLSSAAHADLQAIAVLYDGAHVPGHGLLQVTAAGSLPAQYVGASRDLPARSMFNEVVDLRDVDEVVSVGADDVLVDLADNHLRRSRPLLLHPQRVAEAAEA